MATTTKTATEELAALEGKVSEAEGRLTQITADREKASRALQAAEGTRLDLEERRSAGEDVADKDLAVAMKEIAEAREAANPAVWDARKRGVQRAIEDATGERQRFVRDHFADLAAEIAAEDGPTRDALQEAWETLTQAAGVYARQARRWHVLARHGLLPAETIPNATPLRGDMDEVARRFEGGIPVPTPPGLR